ncbi:metallophosphoesterase [Paracoccus sp. YIM 132242]|uniref:Metallophosphoesterase n=1 Tax=Paracoccus lichenicola TaxID=2665644 RepID=A0A6L6HS31_9RHOB|nr:metallophosphoesterase [Paracoccus lichenicola]
MTTILITADLHLDAWFREGRDPLANIAPVLSGLDALIIAGDLANNPVYYWPRALARIGRLIDPARVHVFPGNHDYWTHHLAGDDVLARIAADAGARYVQKRAIDIGRFRFLCCTLWSDLNLTSDYNAAMYRAWMTMPDYARIRRTANPVDGKIRPEDTVAVHRDHLAWLTRAMAEPWDGQRIVVTHHAPSRAVAGSINGLSPAFASDLDAWIKANRPDAWYFGHTHRRLSAKVQGVPVINVSLGYPDEVIDGMEAEGLLRGLFPSAHN